MASEIRTLLDGETQVLPRTKAKAVTMEDGTSVEEKLNSIGDGGSGSSVITFNGRNGAVVPQEGDYTADMVGARPDTWTPTAQEVGAAPEVHQHAASDVTSGVFPVERGGTGVSTMVGTDYSTNRPRGIILQATEPGSVENGCLVGVYG